MAVSKYVHALDFQAVGKIAPHTARGLGVKPWTSSHHFPVNRSRDPPFSHFSLKHLWGNTRRMVSIIWEENERLSSLIQFLWSGRRRRMPRKLLHWKKCFAAQKQNPKSMWRLRSKTNCNFPATQTWRLRQMYRVTMRPCDKLLLTSFGLLRCLPWAGGNLTDLTKQVSKVA